MIQEDIKQRRLKVNKKKKEMFDSWLTRCKENMQDFRFKYRRMSIEEKVDFSRRQYYLLYLLDNVLKGKSKFEGADINKIKKYKENKKE
jgi:hypothetical protein